MENNLFKTDFEFLKDILESIDECIHVVDSSFNFRFANQYCTKMLEKFGLKPDLSLTLTQLIPCIDENAVAKYRKVFEKGCTIRDRHVLKAGEAEEVYEKVLLPISNSGCVEYVITIMRNITEKIVSEETFRRVSPNIHYLISPEGLIKGKILEINRAIDLLGYKPEELIGKSMSILFDKDELKKFAREFVLPQFEGTSTMEQGVDAPKLIDERRTDQRRTRNLETVLVAKNGQRVPVIINATGLYEKQNKAGIFLGTYGVITDISERKRAESALMKSEELYRSVFENTGTATVIFDVQGRFKMYNTNFEKLTGLKGEELSNTSWNCFITDDSLAEFNDLIKSLESGQVLNAVREIQFRDSNDNSRFIIIKVGNLPESEDRIASIVDITEQKILEDQLTLRQKLDSLGTLAAGIAHDFNNLLVGILGNADFMRLDLEGLNQDQQECLEDIIASSRRAAELISQFQTLTHKGPQMSECFDLYTVAREVFSILDKTTDKLIIKDNLIRPDTFFVSGNATEISQVLLNLGTNAVQAIEEKGITPEDRITLSCSHVTIKEDTPGLAPGQYVHIQFSDNGTGMSDEVKRRAFEPLFTTKEMGRRKGQGLGLAMVYNIVTTHHKGRIEIDTKPGKGTVFNILLPASDDHPQAGKGKEKIPKGSGCILIVDDEETIRKLCRRTLERYGYSVITASDGIEGLDKLRKHIREVDLIILDLTMPRMSGQMMVKQMEGVGSNARILIATGHKPDDVAEDFLNSVHGFLKKPYTMEELLESVQKAITS